MHVNADQSMRVEDYEWAGIIYPEDIKLNVTLITPLAFYDQDKTWQPISEGERNTYFPNNGKVAYFLKDRPQPGTKRLCVLQPKRNQRDSSLEGLSPIDSKYSYYLTYSELTQAPWSLAQIFNWSFRATDIFTIPDLLKEGIPTEECLSHTIFIQYHNQIYGPIYLEPDTYNTQHLKPKEYNQRSNSAGQALLLYGYTFEKEQQIILAGQPFIDRQALGPPINQIDWSLPQRTIKRVLRASKDIATELHKQERLIDREINELAALSASNGPEALHLELCVIQRAQYIIQHQTASLDGLQTLIEELPEHHPLLEKARELEIQLRKDTIVQACATEQDYLQDLQREIQSAQENLAHLYHEVETINQKKEQVSAELATQETSLAQRLTEIRQDMVSLLAELQLTSTLPLTRFQTSSNGTFPETIQSTATPITDQPYYFRAEKITTLAHPHSLPWGTIAKQNGTRARLVRASVAALLAGLVPATESSDIFTVLQAVAQILTGHHIWHVSVPLTAISPLALFGHIQADQQTFLPEAGALADILIEAQSHPEQLGLIILEGIDRVPFLPVIAPLLRQYQTVRQHIRCPQAPKTDPETLPLFHPRALAPENPYQKISRLSWPANLLLGVTFDEDFSSFPLPKSYTPWFARINHLETASPIDNHRPNEQSCYQVSPTDWYAWEKAITERINRQDIPSMPEDIQLWQQAFYTALDHFGMKQGLEEVIGQLWPLQE